MIIARNTILIAKERLRENRSTVTLSTMYSDILEVCNLMAKGKYLNIVVYEEITFFLSVLFRDNL